MFQAILMAAPAPFIARHLEMSVLRGLDLVRCMTVRANWTAFIPLGQELPVNALIVDLLDCYMALAAGLGDVRGVNRRVAIDGAFDAMDSMAIVAGRSND